VLSSAGGDIGVSFSTEIAKVVTDQLSRFVTLNRHQLAGHVANLEFWLAQVGHCLAVIDGYGKRFGRLKAAQAKHIAEHHTTEFLLSDPCCTQRKAALPRKLAGAELRDARRSLCDTAYRFLVRCCKERLLEESALREACFSLGIGVDTADLRPRN
jgi:hypothetical protein